MAHALKQLLRSEIPPQLLEIPQPPAQITIRGSLPPLGTKLLAVVGSRKMTSYGKTACETLLAGLHGYPISIVSGLALGVDACALSAGIRAGLHTIAVPGSGIDDSVIYPRTNFSLAQTILQSGGCLLSEFEPKFKATEWSFPLRNRIMVGLADAVLVIEASEKSGTLITARLTAEYNRDLLVVPGSIFSENSKGVHQFLKLGATPVTESADILEALHLESTLKTETNEASLESDDERALYATLTEPKTREELLEATHFDIQKINTLITILTLRGVVTESSGRIIKL